MVNIKYCHLEVCSVLQRSLWVKPCVKEACDPNKALTTHAIPMKTVALVTEELGGRCFFSMCTKAPVEIPSPLHADMPQGGARAAQGHGTLTRKLTCAPAYSNSGLS